MSNFAANPWPALLLAIIIVVAVWLLIRPIILWYYKIDKVLDVLHEISDTLKGRETIHGNSRSRPSTRLSHFDEGSSQKTWKCPKCQHVNNNNTYECVECGYKLK